MVDWSSTTVAQKSMPQTTGSATPIPILFPRSKKMAISQELRPQKARRGCVEGPLDAWPPGKRDQQPKTGMDFAQFEENVKRRLAEAGVGREEGVGPGGIGIGVGREASF